MATRLPITAELRSMIPSKSGTHQRRFAISSRVNLRCGATATSHMTGAQCLGRVFRSVIRVTGRPILLSGPFHQLDGDEHE